MKVFGFFFMLTLVLALTGCNKNIKVIKTIEDLQFATVGVTTGTIAEGIVRENFPEANMKIFDDVMDAIVSLKYGHVDAVMTTRTTAYLVTRKNEDLTFLSHTFWEGNVAMAVKKGNEILLNDLNMAIATLEKEGILDQMFSRWFEDEYSEQHYKPIPFPKDAENLVVGVNATREPFAFIGGNDNEIVGYDRELAERIASILQRNIIIRDMKFSALIASLTSEKIDFIIANMAPTEERKKFVDFTIPYFKDANVVITRTFQD